MKIKTVSATIERYPTRCGECPFFRLSNYSCHNERGEEGDCELGYMEGHDMRDFSGRYKFFACKIEENPNIKIEF